MAVGGESLVRDQVVEHSLVHLSQLDGNEDQRVGNVAAQLLGLGNQILGPLVQIVGRQHQLGVLANAADGRVDAFFLRH